jgi:hypothetical protein
VAGRPQGFGIAAVAQLELRAMVRGTTREGDPAPAEAKQMLRCQPCTEGVIAAEVMTRLVLDDRSPDDEVCIGLGELAQPVCVVQVIAIAEQDQAIRAVADLVVGMPVVVELLEGHQQVEFPPGSRPRDVPEHGQEERVDRRFVR